MHGSGRSPIEIAGGASRPSARRPRTRCCPRGVSRSWVCSGVCWRYLDSERPHRTASSLTIATGIKLRLILFNILLDDLADDVQDPALFERLASLPCDENGRARPISAGWPAALLTKAPDDWVEYFDLAVSIWNAALRVLTAYVGNDVVARFEPQLGRDYRLILHSMRVGLEINLDPEGRSLRRPELCDVLAHNGNFMAFDTVDRMVLERTAPAAAARLANEHGRDVRAGHVDRHGLELGDAPAPSSAKVN